MKFRWPWHKEPKEPKKETEPEDPEETEVVRQDFERDIPLPAPPQPPEDR